MEALKFLDSYSAKLTEKKWNNYVSAKVKKKQTYCSTYSKIKYIYNLRSKHYFTSNNMKIVI